MVPLLMFTIRSSSSSASALWESTAVVIDRSTAVSPAVDCAGAARNVEQSAHATRSVRGAWGMRTLIMSWNLIAGIGRGAIVVAAAAVPFAGACDLVAKERQRFESRSYRQTDSMGAMPRAIRSVRLKAPPELVENSAAAMSERQPGVLFTINDSGNDALLFAIDTTGAARGVWRVLGATNVDWESAAVAACAPGAATRCVYIGDTGDNKARLPFRAIYKVPEPDASGSRDTVRAERLRYTYSDGPHDVEAMYVAPNGDVVLITKRPLRNAGGGLRPALVFSIAASAWQSRGMALARLVDSLPIVPGSAPLRLITDASLSPDGKHLAVRTYAQVFVFAIGPTGVDHRVRAAVCNITSLGEQLGEGVTWADNRGRLVFTSEGHKVPLNLATCPLP